MLMVQSPSCLFPASAAAAGHPRWAPAVGGVFEAAAGDAEWCGAALLPEETAMGACKGLHRLRVTSYWVSMSSLHSGVKGVVVGKLPLIAGEAHSDL